MLNKRILVLIFLLVFLPLVGCFPSPAPPITENQAPIITSIPITSVTVGETYVYDVKATDPDGDTLTYSLSTKPTGMTIGPATGLIKWTPKAKGNYAVTVKVSDGALSDTQSFTIVVSKPSAPPPVNHAPIIASIPDLATIVGIQYIYEVKATDPDGDVLTYSLTVKPDGMAIDSTTGTVSWIPSLYQIGSNPVTVEASDGKKSTTQSFTIVVEAVKLTGIEVTPNPIILFTDDSQPLKVIANYNDGAYFADVTSNCTYLKEDTCFLSFTINDTGVVTTSKSVTGTSIITVTYEEGGITMINIVGVIVIDRVHNITKVPDEYYNTITEAINENEANPSDTIEVAAGIYPENVTINVDGLILKSVEKYGAEITGKVRIDADDVTVEDFYINFDSITLAPVDLGDFEGVTIIGNKIEGGTDYAGINSWTGPATASGNILIENNEIIKGCIGLCLGNESALATIRDNTMTGPGDEGIWMQDNSNVFLTIENNTVIDAGGKDVKFQFEYPISINGVTDETEMGKAIFDANPGINSVYLLWIDTTLTR